MRIPLPKFGTKLPDGTYTGKIGSHGASVSGFLKDGKVVVAWRERGQRRRESWDDSTENRKYAKAFAEGVLERLEAIRKGVTPGTVYRPIAVRDLWERYVAALEDGVRARTLENYAGRWKKFELFIGREKVASDVTREDLDEFRRALRRNGIVVNQARAIIATVTRVFRFGVERDLIPPTKVVGHTVKLRRGEGPIEVEEYKPDEARKILAQFDPRDTSDWRGYVATHLFAFAGPRQNAARHLTWDDVDLEAGTIRWRKELDKIGAKDRVQPVPSQVLDALWIAYGWRLAHDYRGGFILFRPGAGLRDPGNGWAYSARAAARAAAKADKPWSYAAYNARLREAERAAGVPHVKYRAAHGFRRFVVTEVLERTGNLVTAGQYVGDTDLRTLRKSYVRDRAEQLRPVADHMATALDERGAE